METIVLISNESLNPVNSASIARMINYGISLKKKDVDFFFTSTFHDKYYYLNNKNQLSEKERLFANRKISFFPKLYSLLLREFSFFKDYKYVKKISNKFINKDKKTVFLF